MNDIDGDGVADEQDAFQMMQVNHWIRMMMVLETMPIRMMMEMVCWMRMKPLGSSPLDSASLDTDGDGTCNNSDTDDDDDGHSDSDEITCESDPLDSSSVPLETDSDGMCSR